MCWSATADLVAGTSISAIGVACVAQAHRARDLPLASLPLLLGTHQIIESVVWRSGGGSGPATMVWAVIALPLLPVWVPFGVLLAAPPRVRRRLVVPAAAGLATAAVLAYCLAIRGVTADARGHTLGEDGDDAPGSVLPHVRKCPGGLFGCGLRHACGLRGRQVGSASETDPADSGGRQLHAV
jgi:uncharacterized protein DUF6629